MLRLHEVTRFSAKLKPMTGTYLLQPTRVAFNHTCMLCCCGDEGMINFNLTCDTLEAVRLPEIHDIETGYRLIIRKNLSDESQEYQIKKSY